MIDTMNTSRLVLLIDEEIHAALRTEANRRTLASPDGKRVTMTQVFDELVRENLASALEEVRKARTKKGK